MSYRKDVLRSEAVDFEGIKTRIDDNMIRMLHAAMGIATEAGELVDCLKKAVFYGKTLDLVNLKEELGDLSWYEEIMLDCLSTTREQIQDSNISKLKKRYPEKFSEKKALNRDLTQERKSLGEKTNV